MNTENKNNTNAPEKKKGTDWLCVLFAIWLPLKYAFFIFLIFYLLYVGTDSLIFLFLIILTVLLYLVAVLYLLDFFSKPADPSYSSGGFAVDSDLTSDEEEALSAGLLGGALLGRTFLKNPKSADKKENDFLWQEKTRRDMYDDGFIDW